MTALDPTYLPAVGYLSAVTILVMGARRCPEWVHLAALAVGVPVRAIQEPSWGASALWPVLGAGILFIALVFLIPRLISGVSLFTLVTALALLPYDGWLAAMVGLGLAALVSGWRTWREMGRERVFMLTADTMSVMGVNMAGGLMRPDTTRLLEREAAVDVTGATARSRRMRMYLPPYLLTGVLFGLLVSSLG